MEIVRWKKICLLVLAIALMFQTALAEEYGNPRWTLTSTLGIQFNIAPPAAWEINIPIVCEVRHDGVVIRAPQHIGYAGPDVLEQISFGIVEVDEGRLLALVEQSNPDVVLLLMSTSDSVIWSKGGTEYVHWKEWTAVGEQMLEALKRRDRSRDYVLGVKVPGTRQLLVGP